MRTYHWRQTRGWVSLLASLLLVHHFNQKKMFAKFVVNILIMNSKYRRKTFNFPVDYKIFIVELVVETGTTKWWFHIRECQCFRIANTDVNKWVESDPFILIFHYFELKVRKFQFRPFPRHFKQAQWSRSAWSSKFTPTWCLFQDTVTQQPTAHKLKIDLDLSCGDGPV